MIDGGKVGKVCNSSMSFLVLTGGGRCVRSSHVLRGDLIEQIDVPGHRFLGWIDEKGY